MCVAGVGVLQFFYAGFGFFAFAAGFDGDGDGAAVVGSGLGFAFEVAVTTPCGLRFLQLSEEGEVIPFGCFSFGQIGAHGFLDRAVAGVEASGGLFGAIHFAIVAFFVTLIWAGIAGVGVEKKFRSAAGFCPAGFFVGVGGCVRTGIDEGCLLRIAVGGLLRAG